MTTKLHVISFLMDVLMAAACLVVFIGQKVKKTINYYRKSTAIQ